MLNREPYGATGQNSCHTIVEHDECLGTPKLQAELQLKHTRHSISHEVTSQRWFPQLIVLMLNHVGQEISADVNFEQKTKFIYAHSALLGDSFVRNTFT